MALWTDIVEPAELTGYMREAALDAESDNSLARWLPNALRDSTDVRFTVGNNGLVEEAAFRAYDAAPQIAQSAGGRRVVLELPAIGQERIVSEYAQLKHRNAGEDVLRAAIDREAVRAAQAIVDRMERQRAIALLTGRSTIDQVNFKTDDDFGRDPALTHTASTLWDTSTEGRLAFLESLVDLYVDKSAGAMPGALVMSRKAFRLLRDGDDFKSPVGPVASADVNEVLVRHDLPPVYVYGRKTSAGPVLPDNQILMLPAPVDPTAEFDTALGSTFWGRTLTSLDPNYQLDEQDQPGIVAGVYRGEKPPMIAEVISDAIALPVLENANLSLAAKIAS